MKVNYKRDTRQLINQAWARDPKANTLITGDALILAALMRSTSKGDRAGTDFKQVQRIMGDINYEEV